MDVHKMQNNNQMRAILGNHGNNPATAYRYAMPIRPNAAPSPVAGPPPPVAGPPTATPLGLGRLQGPGTARPTSTHKATSQTKVYGSWMLERELGTGGFGCVKLWKDDNTGERLAVKQCRSSRDLSSKNKERWRAECKIMLTLDHPNVVKAVPVPPELNVPNGELPLLAMEYCSGGDLRRLIVKPEHCCGLPETSVRSIAKDIGSALEYLHINKIVHRDLKPENIILRKEEERVIYKLIDLGYAKDMDKDSICQSFVGTMQYLAPELFRQEHYTRTVDYWSFGTLLFECIAGFRPFLHSKTPVQWQNDICKKRDTDIHAFFDANGRITFSHQLPTPNWLCRTSVDAFERLLHLLLRWDPKRRGGGSTQNDRPFCFDMLEKIMNIKVIHILSVPTNEVFSYPIPEDNRSLQEIMSLLEQESKIPVKEQELLLATGLTAEPSQPAQQCLADPDDSSVPLVYLFRKGETVFSPKKRKLQHYPPLVATMMSEGKASMIYEERRKVWGQSVYFCGEVLRDYKRLMVAQKAAVLCLLRYNTKFSKLKTQMLTTLNSLETKVEFFNQTLDFDKSRFEEQSKTGVFSKRMHLSWAKMREEINHLDPLKRTLWSLDQRCSALSTRIMELQRSPYMRAQHELPLETVEKEAVALYDKLKKASQDERKKAADNMAMVQCVWKCLNQRNHMTNELYLHIGKVAECRVGILKLCPPVEEMVKSLTSHMEKVSQFQKQRQKDIWKLVAVAIKQGPTPSLSRSPSNTSAVSMSSVDSTSTSASIRQNHLERLADSSIAVREDNKQARRQLRSRMNVLQQLSNQAATDDWDFIPPLDDKASPKTAKEGETPDMTKARFDLAQTGQTSNV